MSWNWRFFAAVATITGTIVGAGFLGIPYVVAKSGFLIGIIEIILLGILLLIAKLYLGEILLRTNKTRQLPGIAKLYLGKNAGRIMLFSLIFGIYSALVAYLIGEGESLSYIFTGSMNYSIYFALGFWLLLSVFVYRGIRALKTAEIIGMISVFALFVLILIYFLDKINIENLLIYDFNYAFLPIGVIIFAFMGFSAMPEVLMVIKNHEKLLKKAIIVGAIIPIVVYAMFALIVVGFSGARTPEIATFALGKLFVLLGILTMFTSFFPLSMAIRDTYYFDLKYSKMKSWILTSFVPLILFLVVYFFKIASFTQVLGIGGIISGGIIGVLVLLMVKNARKLGKRKPEYKMKLPSWVVMLLIFILISAILLQLVL